VFVPKKQQRRDVLVEAPVELHVVRKHPHTVATGLPAVLHSMQAGLKSEGPLRFARMLGTNNLPNCSNMCHESSGAALGETLGVGKSTVTLADLENADCIIVMGQNPGTNHPRMLTSLQKAKRNGATMISINPLREAGLLNFRHPQEPLCLLGVATKLSDHFLQVRINGDLALLKGFAKALLEREERMPGSVLDRAFIDQYAAGFEAYAADLRAASWDGIVASSGIAKGRILEIAEVLAKAKGVVACWAMGLTQHKNAVPTIRELVNVMLLRGNVGRPRAGLLCVRGHSNVQGDRTGRIKTFISLGGNFLSASPDTHRVGEGLRNCGLTVSIATKLNRSHLVTGDTAPILPCLSRTERDEQASGLQFATVENTVKAISSSRGLLRAASPNLRSEAAIVAGLAGTTLRGKHPLDWSALVANYGNIRDHVSRVVTGFENFNERVRSSEPFYAPVVVYGLDDRYRGIYGGRRVIFLNLDDVAERGLRDGQLVDITSRFGEQLRTVERFRIVGYDIPRGCAATYYPETNPLVQLENHADISGTPASKSVIIKLASSAQTSLATLQR
jgi:anaerobic selenocysteine-containing dehydrogenase